MATSVVNLASILSPANSLNSASATTKAKAQTSPAGSAPSTTSNDGLTGTSTGSTFLNLLVKELQNQDPTAPLDSTAMVGQMISLNQLDQLISINQVLSTATGSTATGSSTKAVSSPAASSSAQMAQRTALLNTLQNTSAAQAASDPSQTLDLSTLNIPHGGK